MKLTPAYFLKKKIHMHKKSKFYLSWWFSMDSDRPIWCLNLNNDELPDVELHPHPPNSEIDDLNEIEM